MLTPTLSRFPKQHILHSPAGGQTIDLFRQLWLNKYDHHEDCGVAAILMGYSERVKFMIDVATVLGKIPNMQNNSFFLGGEEVHFSCKTNPPATLDGICGVEKNHALSFPDSLKKFWTITNGLVFNQYGGTCIYSIEEVDSYCKEYADNMKAGVYLVGVFDGDTIAIDSERVPSENYLFCGDIYSLDMFWEVGNTFEFFLEKILLTSGYKFWDWTPWDASHRLSGPYTNLAK